MQNQSLRRSQRPVIARAAFANACSSGQQSIETGSGESASSAASIGSVAAIQAIEHVRPPFSKKPRTAIDREGLESCGADCSNSSMLAMADTSFRWADSAAQYSRNYGSATGPGFPFLLGSSPDRAPGM